jgi:superfamily I DNA/RNA helicase
MPESTIIMTKAANKLESVMKKKAYAFLEKLAENDAAPGLHIEPIKNSVDKKVRTGRVDQGYRAVLFKLTEGGSNTYVFHGIWPHDDAITVAGKTTLTVNPVNGVAEIRVVGAEASPTAQSADVARQVTAAEQPIAAPAPPVAKPPWAFPVSIDDLVTHLGLPLEVAERAHAASDEDQLLDYAGGLENWQGQALLNLATGMSVAEAKAELEIEPVIGPIGDSDDDILKGLRHPAARIQFAEIEGRDELRRVIESGDFGAWRVFLHPQQRGMVDRTFNGPAKVTGGAGTGKTVVLLHRARHLLTGGTQARVVFTTYTKNLAEALAADLEKLEPNLVMTASLGTAGVFVAGIDSLASTVIKRAGTDIASDVGAVLGQGRLDVLKRSATDSLWKSAIDSAGKDLPEQLKSVAFFESEYGLVVLPNRITAKEDYLRVRRPGRGVRLSRKERITVWSVIESYRLGARMASAIDYQEAAAIAAHHLEHSSTRPADHVLVDEGQDLSPAHWQLVRALADEGTDDIFIAEDGHQRIYGHRTVLSRYGIRTVGRSRRLTLNYRTTAETLAYAVSLLEGTEYRDLEDDVDTTDKYRSARRGPKPEARGFDSLADEFSFVADTVRGWLKTAEDDGIAPETIAILVRDRFQRDRIVTALDDLGVSVRGVDREAVKPGEPVVMTMHRAKGTEFSNVVLFGLGAKSMPPSLKAYEYSEIDLQEAVARERSLLYVAASRARDELVVTWSGEPSDLL